MPNNPSHERGNRRPRAAVPLADLPKQLRIDADEMNGIGAGNEAEHARQAADEIERLRAAFADAKRCWEMYAVRMVGEAFNG